MGYIKEYLAAGAPCIFNRITGYYCPGCGGTRSVIAFLHGHFIQSFIYHPLVPYTAFACLFLLINKIRSLKTDKPVKQPYTAILVIALIIVIVNFIVKNVLLYLGVDLL